MFCSIILIYVCVIFSCFKKQLQKANGVNVALDGEKTIKAKPTQSTGNIGV